MSFLSKFSESNACLNEGRSLFAASIQLVAFLQRMIFRPPP